MELNINEDLLTFNDFDENQINQTFIQFHDELDYYFIKYFQNVFLVFENDYKNNFLIDFCKSQTNILLEYKSRVYIYLKMIGMEFIPKEIYHPLESDNLKAYDALLKFNSDLKYFTLLNNNIINQTELLDTPELKKMREVYFYKLKKKSGKAPKKEASLLTQKATAKIFTALLQTGVTTQENNLHIARCIEELTGKDYENTRKYLAISCKISEQEKEKLIEVGKEILSYLENLDT